MNSLPNGGTDAVSGAATFAFAYGRVSSGRGTGNSGMSRQEESLEVQNEQFQNYLHTANILENAFGENYERVFLERHTGAFEFGDIRTRPNGALLWSNMEKTRLRYPDAKIHLIFSKIDRFSRGWLEGQIVLRDLRTLKVKLHILALGGESFDCESDMGVKMLSDLLWLGEMEVKMIKSRIRENKESWRAKGLFLGGGNAPYGCDLKETGQLSPRGKKTLRADSQPGRTAVGAGDAPVTQWPGPRFGLGLPFHRQISQRARCAHQARRRRDHEPARQTHRDR
jgi:DNA invertase Pin-like site-specific DNA recombinase